MTDQYANLLQPGEIGSMALRNRIVVTAMGVNLAETDGTCGDRMRAYHVEQARGGVGLIITGATGVAWPIGAVMPNQFAISEDRFIESARRLADAVHAEGAKLALQLHQGGLNAVEDMINDRPAWTPSLPSAGESDAASFFLMDEIKKQLDGGMAKAARPEFKVLEQTDINLVVEQFGKAAVRAKEAGVDAVEVHAGHGYLLGSFLSASKNKRTDEYGGSLENRARFVLEVVRAVRAAVGEGYPVLCKLDSREVGRDNGITLDDAVRTAQMVEAAGASAITVSAYHNVDRGLLHTASHTPHQPALNLPAAATIKAAVNVPVIASGRVEPDVGDAAIAKGELDFLSMGRKILADPALPNKLANGQAEDIRPCIYCYTCISAIYIRDCTRCAVNPRLGFEYLHGNEDTNEVAGKQRIVVVGGGPAGMEAATRLDRQGHKVTLIEQGSTLGGTLQFAALAYDANEKLLDWQKRQLTASNVNVQLNTQATVEKLKSLAPDTVIVATGAKRALPDIPGANLDHVFSGDDMRGLLTGGPEGRAARQRLGTVRSALIAVGTATGATKNLSLMRNATKYWMPFDKNIAVIGGGLVGLELAEFLCARGVTISVVGDEPIFGEGLTYLRRARLITELRDHGVQLHPGAKDIAIDAQFVHFTDATGEAQRVPASQVIVAQGAEANNSLADALREAGFVVKAIGDCTGVGYIEGAIRGAADAVDELNASSS